MAGICVEIVYRGALDNESAVHDHYAISDPGHHTEVVRNPNNAHADFLAELLDEFQDLGLDRHVKRGLRLVGDEHLWLAGKCNSDHHPLAHPAGELVGIVVHPVLWRGDADQGEKLDRTLARLATAETEMLAQRLLQLLADRQDRVERRHRVWKMNPTSPPRAYVFRSDRAIKDPGTRDAPFQTRFRQAATAEAS